MLHAFRFNRSVNKLCSLVRSLWLVIATDALDGPHQNIHFAGVSVLGALLYFLGYKIPHGAFLGLSPLPNGVPVAKSFNL